MVNVAVIGAGISGLTVARLLARDHNVVVLEQSSVVGGIARTRNVDGIPYHLVGGHCLNSHNLAVMEFVRNQVLPPESWHKVDRLAQIVLSGHRIDYPIEFSVRQIAAFDAELAYRITCDLLASQDREVDNLQEWFRMKFGAALAETYFIPYNSKIWNRDPREMSPEWVAGKLPVPNKKQFFQSLMMPQRDNMPHSSFYYPNTRDNEFVEALAAGLDVRLEYRVERLERQGAGWLINGELAADLVISTIPLNLLPALVEGTPPEVLAAAGNLRYNRVSNMLWETDEIDATWTYYPEPTSIFHRHIHIGNFLAPKTRHTITETVGTRSPEELVKAGQQLEYLRKPLDHHVSDHAYVVYDHNYAPCVNAVKGYLASIGIRTLGRFGEWEYYNMDVCMESAMRLADELREVGA